MRENWRPTLPFTMVPVALGAVYLLTYGVDMVAIWFGLKPPAEENNWRIAVLSMAAAFQGGWRVAGFHPFYNSQYRKWLSVTPWSCGQPLPQGPVHLIWTDALTVAAMCLVAYSDSPAWTWVPIPVFMCAYLVVVNVTFAGKLGVYSAIALFAAPLAVYPYRDIYVALAVLAGLYVLARVGLHQYFRDFPWSTDYWTVDMVEEMKKNAIRQNVIGWPFKLLCVREREPVSLRTAVIIGLIVTWWMEVFCQMTEERYSFGFFMLAMSVIYVAGFRTLGYTALYRSPISIFGRISTGRLIIPKYDKVFIAPLCIVLAGAVVPLALWFAHLNGVWAFRLCVFSVAFFAVDLPPTRRDWQLTGAHRPSRIAQSIRSKPPQDQKLVQFVQDMVRAIR
jgi:hypothetical protein